jgi:hypothetical protein
MRWRVGKRVLVERDERQHSMLIELHAIRCASRVPHLNYDNGNNSRAGNKGKT